MLEDIKVGDRVINSLGEEAVVTYMTEYDSGRIRLFFHTPITGWAGNAPKISWSYTKKGKFVRESDYRPAADLVKVIKHD